MLKYKQPEKVLICLPTYHSVPEWLDRAVQSIQSQTYPYFDCFIVKDACSKCEINCLECDNCNNTSSTCKYIESKDTRFKYFKLPMHCSGAGWGPRNFAILNSNNNLIAYLDDDNWYEPDHIQCLIDSIKEKDSDMAYTGTRIIDKDNTVTERIHNDLPKQGYIDTSEMMHKRWLIDKYGGWRYVKKCNDWDLVSRWGEKIKWAHTKKITLNFFLREGCGIHRK